MAGVEWAVYLLCAGSILSILYLMPIIFMAWLGKPKEEKKNFPEKSPIMLLPPIITALLTVLFGVFQHEKLNPITWVKFIASIEYGP